MRSNKLLTLIGIAMLTTMTMLIVGCQVEGSKSHSNESGSNESGNEIKVGEWESWQTIEITEGKGTTISNVSVSTPWNTEKPQNAFGTYIATEIKKSAGWELILNTCAKDGYGPGRNYLIFYNDMLGIMRVFYYCDVEITGTGNEHFWQIIMGQNQDRASYYGQLPFGVAQSQKISFSIPSGSFTTENIFNQMVTNYQKGSNKTLAYKSWNCFEVDMSSYSTTQFSDANDQITFQLYATKTSNVTLESTISAKLTGTIDIDKVNPPAASSSKGIFDTIMSLKDYGSKIWDVGKTAFGLFSGTNILDSINTIAGAVPGLITSTKGYIDDIDDFFTGRVKEEKPQETTYTPTYRGTVNVNINGTIDTAGYITENGIAADIPVFTVSSAIIPHDSKFGEGVWNLKDVPQLIMFENLMYKPDAINEAKNDDDANDYRTYNFPVTMLDPESITLILRDDIKQNAKNIYLETVWGFMDDDISYAEYRTAMGLSNDIKFIADEQLYYLYNKFPEFSQRGEGNLSHVKFLDGALTDKYTRQIDDKEYIGYCLKMEALGKKFFAFPQSEKRLGTYYGKEGLSLPADKIIVMARLQFDLNGKRYVYTRRFLPNVSCYIVSNAADEKVKYLLDMRKKRKAAGWKVDGVFYPVVQSELENLYDFYYNTNTGNWTVNERSGEWCQGYEFWKRDERYRD